jgi:hypothetical protein
MKKIAEDFPSPIAAQSVSPTEGGDLAALPMPSEGGAFIRQKDGSLARDDNEPVPSAEDDRVQTPLKASVKEG